MKPLLLVLALARGADVATTCYDLHYGNNLVEGNPLLPNNCAGIAGVNAAGTAVEIFFLRRWNKTHPKLTKAIAIGSIGVSGFAAVHNMAITVVW